jgi:hypothetical protein
MATETKKFGDVKMMMSEKPIPNTIFQSRMISAKHTFENMKKGTKNATKLDYEEIQEYLQENKKTFFDKKGKYKINILTDIGWKGGKTFDGYNFEFYDPVEFYNDANASIENIYAVQIVVLKE